MGDFTGLNRKVKSEKWDLIFDKCDNVNEFVEQICKNLISLAKQYVSIKLVSITSKDKFWMIEKICVLIRNRKRWHDTYNRTTKLEHKTLRNFYHGSVKQR